MAVRVAINGFGRIGRNVMRAIMESGRKDIEVVSINDLGPVETNAHLFRFDSVHGRFNGEVKVDGDTIDVGRGKNGLGDRSHERDQELVVGGLGHHEVPSDIGAQETGNIRKGVLKIALGAIELDEIGVPAMARGQTRR